jgi:methylglyoxal synthase
LRSDADTKFPVLATARRQADEDYYAVDLPPGPFPAKTIALIAHDEMKPRMVDFAIEFENELATSFARILTTGTTGRDIQAATRKLGTLIRLCRSGPKGGDVEIATEILFRRVLAVVFFVDPLHPHAHIDDVRTVFSACLRTPQVLLLTNEVQAREWIRS